MGHSSLVDCPGGQVTSSITPTVAKMRIRRPTSDFTTWIGCAVLLGSEKSTVNTWKAT